jgi:hypothetical protein
LTISKSEFEIVKVVCSGQLFNKSELRRDVGVSQPTIEPFALPPRLQVINGFTIRDTLAAEQARAGSYAPP